MNSHFTNQNLKLIKCEFHTYRREFDLLSP
jgi:hypothetical protein